LRHLGACGGAIVAAELLPDGCTDFSALAAGPSIEDFSHCLPPPLARLTVDDMDKIAAQGWAALGHHSAETASEFTSQIVGMER
jgi:hypothetical protein